MGYCISEVCVCGLGWGGGVNYRCSMGLLGWV